MNEMGSYRIYSLREAAALFGVSPRTSKKHVKRTNYILNTEKLEDKINTLFLKPDVEEEHAVYVEQRRQLFRGRFNVTRVLEREKAIGLAFIQKEKKKVNYDKIAKTTSYIIYDLIFKADNRLENDRSENKNDLGLTLKEVKNNYRNYEFLKE